MVEELVSNECENDDNDVGTTDPNFADEEENPQNSNPKLTNSISTGSLFEPAQEEKIGRKLFLEGRGGYKSYGI